MIVDAAFTPKVSVGFPIRNGGALLKEAMRSVLEQTEQDFEIIVSDNGSDDGTTEYLKDLAASDSRIRYFRQEPAIRAYDNFRFVLDQARAEYFMWAAHDDTRDPEFIAKLVQGLENDPAAILAFCDLNITTPADSVGSILPFSFQTTGMGLWSRLWKGSRLQCFHIYGMWRTKGLRRVPYAYCAWWPDLPMMLAAAVVGTFLYVPGVKFHYLELPKSSLDRVKNQDFKARFNLLFGVTGLIGATFRACAAAGGLVVGLACASFVALKQVINFPGFFYRRVRRLFNTAEVG